MTRELTHFTIWTETRPNLAELVASRFDGFTLTEALGYWKGQPEQSTKIDIIAGADRYVDVLDVAGQIQRANEQTTVLVTSADIRCREVNA